MWGDGSCKKCGTVKHMNDGFCHRCGARLRDDAKAWDGKFTCKDHGRGFTPGHWLYCTGCGARLRDTPDPDVDKEAREYVNLHGRGSWGY